MESRNPQEILAESPTLRHLWSRLGTTVQVHPRDAPMVEGVLKTIDPFRGLIEVEGREHVWFFNLFKVNAIRTNQMKARS